MDNDKSKNKKITIQTTIKAKGLASLKLKKFLNNKKKKDKEKKVYAQK